MSENRQETEILFIQALSGHSFTLQTPELQGDVGYAQLIMNVQAMGYMVCGEIRIPWHSIAFVARGEAARSLIAAQQQRTMAQPLAVAGMIPQGAA